MKSLLIATLVMTPPPGIGVVDDLFDPLPAVETSINRVPWTIKGGQFLIDGIRTICQDPDAKLKCENVRPGNIDYGFKVLKDGRYLFVFDRAIAEEVQQDYAAARRAAEEHHPYSNHVSKLESTKSQLEYIAIACNSGFGPYCGGMAAKVQKLAPLILAACAGALSTCQKLVKDKQTEIQKEIDKVLAVCQKSDQACFDYITGGKETQATEERRLEESDGSRPPHTPNRAGYRPQFMPGQGTTDAMWDKSCEHCKVYDGDEAE
jgi:hypothetical protein